MLEIHLYGNLRAMVPGSSSSQDTVLTCKHKTGETFSEFVHRLGLSMMELGDCFINGVLAKPSDVLKDGDRIGLFPPHLGILLNVRVFAGLRQLCSIQALLSPEIRVSEPN